MYIRFQGDFFCWGAKARGLRGRGFSLEEFFMGEKKFHEGGTGFSLHYLKNNDEKINMKKFFQLEVRSSITIYNELILLRI